MEKGLKAMQSTAKSFVRFAHYAFSAIDSDVMQPNPNN
uniref:Uncharacterized protein n=1 Tax=Klebsiella aerogenes TaxID=548 RepID=A0A142CPL0_KLEAE|nr:hypothetical protein [Klebsiella aerogenes]